MYLSTFAIKLLGVGTFLVFKTFASLNNHLTNDASNFHQLNPASGSYARPRGDLQPVSYLQKNNKRLYNKEKFIIKRSQYNKRDYATTLRYLRAAMSSYRKDLVTPPPVELIQLEQQLPPAPPAPPVVEQIPIPEQTSVIAETSTPTITEEVTPLPNVETEVTPDLSTSTTTSSTDTALDAATTNVVLSDGSIESIPLSVDLEEDDYFDPEEDPDDVDAPPFANGRRVNREE